jgi:hypothetical protein
LEDDLDSSALSLKENEDVSAWIPPPESEAVSNLDTIMSSADLDSADDDADTICEQELESYLTDYFTDDDDDNNDDLFPLLSEGHQGCVSSSGEGCDPHAMDLASSNTATNNHGSQSLWQ